MPIETNTTKVPNLQRAPKNIRARQRRNPFFALFSGMLIILILSSTASAETLGSLSWFDYLFGTTKAAAQQSAAGSGDETKNAVIGATITVDDDMAQCPAASFTTIQAAVDAAAANEIIQVCAGNYPESVSVAKSLIINGPQAGVDARTRSAVPEAVVGGGQTIAFNVTGTPTVTINGFTISTTSATADNPAVFLQSGSGHVVSNNIFTTSVRRASYFSSPDTTFQNNRVSSSFDGFFGGVNNATIQNNLFDGTFNSNSGAAVNTTTSSANVPANNYRILNNQFTSPVGNFAVVFATSNSLISGNTVTGATFSAVFIGGGNSALTVSNNTIKNGTSNAVSFGGGFGYGADTNIAVTSNNFEGNRRGIRINTPSADTTTGIVVRSNRFKGNLNNAVSSGIVNDSSVVTVDAVNNYFGCDEGPSNALCDAVIGQVTAEPHLMLDVIADSPINNGTTSTITARFISSDPNNTTPAPIADGIPIVFSGAVATQTKLTTGGTATTTFTDNSTTGDQPPVTVTGTVDNSSDDAIILVEDMTAPVVASVVRAAGEPNPRMDESGNFVFTVTFSEAVTGVDSTDFAVATTGGLSGTPTITVSADSGTTRTVTVSGFNNANVNGTVRLNVLDDDTIIDVASNSLSGGFTTGETFTVVMENPNNNCVTGRRVYNVVTEFSIGGNPNCAYTYGSTASPTDETFSNYTTPIVGAFDTPGIDGWYSIIDGNQLTLPGIFKNNNLGLTQYPANNNSIQQPAGTLAFHPGMMGQRSVLRFTVPSNAAGFYNLSGSFTGIDNGGTPNTPGDGTTTDVSIFVNGASVAAGDITSFGDTETFNFPINLPANATVDFRVGYGANANYGNDSTTLAATLTPINAPMAETLYGLSGTTTGTQSLVTFDSSNPNVATTIGTITGLQTGETLYGIDFRPATGQLYGLGSTSRLYTINITSGAALPVGTAGAFTLSGTQFGFDFNPTVDRIRVVSNTGQNLRLNPNNGALAATDTPLAYRAANPTATPPVTADVNAGTPPNVTAAAYTNNVSNLGSTVLYDIDSSLNILATQAPPNNGTLNTVGATGVDVPDANGFDISGLTNVAYASFGNQLYTVDLTTGAVSPVGAIGTFTDFTGVTAAPKNVAPIVRTITRLDPNPTNAASVRFLVTFSEPVTGVDATDFQFAASNQINGLGITGIVQGAADPNTYTVTVSIGTAPMGTTLRLDVVDNDSIVDASNMPLGGAGTGNGSFMTGDFYTIDKTPPTVTINQEMNQPDPTNVSPVNFTVVFSEAVTDFDDATDVVITGTAFSAMNPATITITPVGTGGTTYNVAVGGTNAMGTVTADVAAGAAIDAATNPNAASTSTDNTVTFDNAAPTVTINQAINQPDPTSASPINFTVTFSEAVSDFDDPTDVTVTGTAFSTTNPTGTPVVVIDAISRDRRVYNVRISGMTSSGTVIANVPAGVAVDVLNNPNTAATFTDNTVNFALETIYALTNPAGTPLSQSLITFSSSNPNAASTPLPITGLGTGETLVGIDFRPSTIGTNPNRRGILYGISVANGVGRVYTINTTSGAATLTGVIAATLGGTPIAISGTEFGVDFNPVPDRIRVISNTGQNLRVNPDNGVTVVDGALNPFDTNGTQRTGVSGAAYTNNVNGATATMLFDIDAQNDQLLLQTPPNEGTLTVRGPLGIDVNEVNGFDISGTTTTAYAALQTAGATDSALYTINTTTGTASLVGTIGGVTGSGLTIRGLSAAPPVLFVDNAGPTATITQAVGQADPTNASPINFNVTFSEPVTDFDDAADTIVTGTAFSTTTPAGTPVVVITPISRDSTVFNVRISGMTSNGTVILNVPAGAAVDLVGNPNTASDPAVGDNTVTYTRPAITISDVTATEGNTTTKTFDFTVTLSSAITETVTVDYATANGSATASNPAAAGDDYVSQTDTLTFLPTDPLTKTVSITVNGDTTVEPDETFFVNLTNNSTNSTIGDAQGLGTITNDDVQISFSSATYSVTEGTPTATITVNRSGVNGTVLVNYATADGSATAGSDYTAVMGQLEFTSNETTETFTIPITDDLLSELAETVNLSLSLPAGSTATLVTPSTAVLTINDNESNNTGQVTISGVITQNGQPLSGVTVTLSGSVPATYRFANPATTGPDGRYSFPGLPGNATNPNNNYLVTPSASNLVFDPVDRSYVNLGMSVTNANFVAYTPPIPRNLRIGNTNQPTLTTSTIVVPITLDSLGNENSLSFSLNYETARLSNPVVACGSDAPGCDFTTNTNVAGQLGIEFTRANDAMGNQTVFTAGTGRQVVTVTFTTTPGAASSTPITFGDTPTTRDVNDVDGNSLLSNYINGTVVFAQGFEGDVAGRNTGSGGLTGADITILRAFVSGTQTPDPNFNEFQRADVAPAGTKGGGTLTSGDVTVLRNYITNGILTPAGGPTQLNMSLNPFAAVLSKAGLTADAAAAAGDVRVTPSNGVRGMTVTVPITLDARGTENGFSFTVNFEQGKLSNPVVSLGSGLPAGSSLNPPNVTQVSQGRIGIVANLPEGQSLAAGVKQIITVTFNVNQNAALGTSPISFGNTPQAQDINDNAGDSLPANYIASSVTISSRPPTSSTVSIEGRLVNSNGQGGVSKAVVTLTNSAGKTRTVVSDFSGNFRFDGVQSGETVIIGASHKRFTFAAQTVTPNDNVTDLILTAQP